MRRMDRYNESSDSTRLSRATQNQELYENIGTNTKYANFSDVTNANAIDISDNKNYHTREGYQQMRQYQNVVETPRVKKELEEFKSLYQNRENRVYDINNVLEEARKNRAEKDELEEKRKLKNTSYNILASLNTEELEKYQKEAHKVVRPNDEDLRELIDTITSATLAGDINAASDLLSDLMATSIMDKVESPEDKAEEKEEQEKTSPTIETTIETNIKINQDDLKELSEAQDKAKETTGNLKGVDTDFYTRSMDLSDQDFELADEINEKHLPVGLKILIVIIIIAIVAALSYFAWQYFKN